MQEPRISLTFLKNKGWENAVSDVTDECKLANLSPGDMDAVYNMRFLQAAPETKTSASAISLNFHHKELIKKLSKNELPLNEFPCLNDPSPTFHGSARVHDTPGRSVRSRPSTWARPRSSDDGYSSDSVLRRTSGEFKKMGKRIFIFIVGGATRSELRVCHQLTTKLKREIVLGSSSLDDPAQFVEISVALEESLLHWAKLSLHWAKVFICGFVTTKLRRDIILGSTSLDDPAHFVKMTEVILLLNIYDRKRGFLEGKAPSERKKREMGEILTWLLFFFILIALLVVVIYQLMCLADLEFDYINPYDSASRINFVILPEFITHGVLCLIYLLTGHWVMFLLALPYLYYNVRLYTRKQHLVDVTEIFNQLNWEKKQRLFKLGYLVFLLFITLFWMIYNALEDDEM
ncbi:hypothetical protein L1987_05115 [Smallanthus sonchifolius]|uniref:Uncharacterized protein n=1 Tax=Smallanthus sonchifolius TaxID=185202 RepID=A0ACB9JUP3_9ASTR|nr:hypothetical protein L1987_05115 [Smallanthus sonchifolius]